MEPEEQPLASPPVLAVVVTLGRHADRFEDLLGALAEQDYPDLSVLVVDASGGDDPTERVRAVLPDARVLRIPAGQGFTAAANRVLDARRPRVRRARFFVFCHDDVTPEPGAVTALVAAATEWDADVVGPKYVDADDPGRLLQVGLAVDRVGTTLPLVERRELDQGQHDGVREVFAVPSGFTLVRAARFAEVGGFDEAVGSPDDDLVLCWRARAAGSRVLVTTDARVRREDEPAAPDRERARQRLRAVLGCSSLLDLVWVLPQALAVSLAQAGWGLVTARPGRCRAALGAWLWNLLRPLSLWRARRRVKAVRRAPDRDIHRMQARGLIRPRLRLRRMAARGEARAPDGAGAGPPVPPGDATSVDAIAPWTPATALVATALAGVVLFGTRHLLTRGVPAVGEFVGFPGGAVDLLRQWVDGYRSVGLGAEASAPTLVGAAGGLGALLGGHPALARTLLIVGLLPLGIVGAYRLLRPTGSKPAQVAAAVAYAAVPLPYDGLATGRWSVVAAYAASPWLLGRLAQASGVAPFSPEGRQPVPRRPLWQHVIATGATTALAGLLVPQAPALLLLAAAGLVVGTLLAFRSRGTGRLVAAALGGAVVAAALHLPALVDIARSRTAADAWLGLERPPGALTGLDLLRLDTGPFGIAPLGFCLVGAAALPLLIGRDWRLAWAIRAWGLAVACGAVVWAQQQGRLDVRLPDPGVLLAPAAAGLTLAVALGVAAIELDVRGRSWRFGVRRLVSALGVLALVAAAAPVVVRSLDGWWDMPPGQFAGVMGSVDAAVATEPSRVVWVGDPAVLPGGQGWELGGGLAYTATGAATPGVADLWPATGLGASGRLGEALRYAADGQTSRLGRMLAPMGVQYVAVPRSLAPASAVERTGDGGVLAAAVSAPGTLDGLIESLDGQLDLEQVPVDDALALYRNVAFAPMRATGIDEAALAETSVAEMQHVDVSAAVAALVESNGGDYRGLVPADGATIVQASSASDRWVLEVDGRQAERIDAYGWADAFRVPAGPAAGEAILGYDTPAAHDALLGLQGALWLVALVVVVRMRRRSERPAPPPAEPGGIEPPASGAAGAAAGAGGGDGQAPEAGPPAGDAPGREDEAEPVPAGAPT